MIKTSARVALATAAFAFFAGPAFAEGASGSWTAQITKQEARPLGSADHVLVSQVGQGSNRSAGGSGKFDGAQVLLSEIVELNKGSGPQHGLLSLIDAKGSKTSEYSGKITTTMVDGQPRTSGKGTYRFVSGTGAYANDKDSGVYSFTMTSPTDVAGEWKENDKAASR